MIGSRRRVARADARSRRPAASISATSSRPRSARRSNSVSWSKRVISTSQSTGVPRPPIASDPSASRVTARTPRYSVGAVRRFSRTSASHASRRQLDGREIDVVEADGALELERAIARQPDDADVRVDALDGTGASARTPAASTERRDLTLQRRPAWRATTRAPAWLCLRCGTRCVAIRRDAFAGRSMPRPSASSRSDTVTMPTRRLPSTTGSAADRAAAHQLGDDPKRVGPSDRDDRARS